LLALWLAFVTLAGVAPSARSFAAGGCTMPCCRARKGAACPSCHHNRLKRAGALASAAHDHVCGARLKYERELRYDLSTPNIKLDDASADADAVYEPCTSDCAGLLTSPTQSKRGRDDATASQSIRPPPVLDAARAAHTRRADASTSELCPRCSPRAPPSDTPRELARRS
jgi:hypothetical protein